VDRPSRTFIETDSQLFHTPQGAVGGTPTRWSGAPWEPYSQQARKRSLEWVTSVVLVSSASDSLDPAWWVVRSVVDITVAGEPSDCEDRFVLIRADSEEEARAKGEHEAQEYGSTYLNKNDETVTWKVRGIVDVREVISADLADGTEVYSAFIDSESAAALLTPRQSPVQTWQEANPGKDANQATVREILEHDAGRIHDHLPK
jgi:Domain of unknown function (DUF4288)